MSEDRREEPVIDLDRPPADPSPASPRAPRLDILKALGDNTRYAIYLELARSPLPLATADIADILELHVNTVRPHLERMREVGLLRVDTEARGGVGRPQHRYSLSADAPSLGLEPSPFPTLARVLLRAAAQARLERSELADAGHEQGLADAQQWPEGTDTVEALTVEQARLGFDPTVIEDDAATIIAFAHCPFRELAEANPDLVCGLHSGLVAGLVQGLAGAGGGCSVRRFQSLLDRHPCQVELVASGAS